MGIEVRCTMSVGFEVSEADLWEADGSKSACERGHEKVPGTRFRFCPEDGTPFSERAERKPTEAFRKLDAFLKLRGGSWEEKYEFLRERHFLKVSKVHSADDKKRTVMALAIPIGETGPTIEPSMAGPETAWASRIEVQNAFEISENTRKATGLDGRQSRLFLSAEVSG